MRQTIGRSGEDRAALSYHLQNTYLQHICASLCGAPPGELVHGPSLALLSVLPRSSPPLVLHAQAPTPGEARAERVLESAKKAGNPELYALLKTMPKGADLHMHLSGAIYAETFIDDAARDGLCLAPVEAGTPPVAVGQDALHFAPPQHGKANDCATGQVPVADAFKNQALYDLLVDSFSMRAFVATEAINGHDQFFATFARFERHEGSRRRVAG